MSCISMRRSANDEALPWEEWIVTCSSIALPSLRVMGGAMQVVTVLAVFCCHAFGGKQGRVPCRRQTGS